MTAKISVLHADDEPDFAEMVATFLEREDDRLEIDTVSSADEGLDRLSRDEYQCIISDYDMPGTDGIEFLRRVRDRWPDVPFILFTGKGSEEVASEAISAGVTDYLQKRPGTERYQLLANRLTNAVDQHRAERRLHEERRRFRALFDRFSQATVEIEFDDDEPIITRVNPAFEDTFGYDAETLIGNSADRYLIPDGRRSEAEAVNRQLRSGGYTTPKPVTRRTADGPRKFLLQTAVYDDGTSGFVIYTDITEAEERERALERSRGLLRHTQELAGVGGWEADVETGEQRWTRGTYAIHGLDPDGEFDPAIDAGIEFYHPDDQGTIAEAVERCRTHGDPFEHELRLNTAENDEKWVKATGEPVYEDGEIVTIRGAIQDITAQKERERHLQQYEQLVRYSPELLVLLDEGMTVEYQSPPSPLLEWEPLDVDGVDPLGYIHPEDHDAVRRQTTQLAEHPDEVVTTEFRVRDADDEWRWVESRAQNFIDDEPLDGVLAAMREISTRKRQEQQLAQYSTFLEQLHETTQTLLETTDVDEAARSIITGIETIFEFDIVGVWLRADDRCALEPVATSERGQDLIAEPPTYTPEGRSLSWAAYEEGTLRYIADMSEHDQRMNPDTLIGSELIVPIGRYGVLNIGATEPEGFTEQDIKLLELWSDTLRVILERITQIELLRKREAELTRERDRLDEFTGILSHDLRNPLTVAQGRLRLAAEETGNDHLLPATRALDRIETLLDESLALARQGKVVGETESVAVEAIAKECWETVPTEAATLAIEDPPTIRADTDRLPQVFENLFTNAVEHSGRSVTITVRGIDGGFCVADDGVGIPAEDRSRLFERGVTTSGDGRGFGLAIVKQICEAHGWQIDVAESDAGGAQFRITNVDLIE
ncbi:hybrid sensor histidine kinase/response regulator [Halorubrum vacuolatum]|uniref:histidine kinase n=1 Tax=Halorubrum vacuolatum TaxID=63740 RepID=A0A238UWF2_HALVU|nr:PAS domain S-box protein [Halorubrum vacuolatum]SNR26211.1 PAS domain S-box-containing protein [Halorubrum vacuolatum]